MNTYKISDDHKSITCLGCGFTSFHPKDIENHYCGHCHIWHDDYVLGPGLEFQKRSQTQQPKDTQ